MRSTELSLVHRHRAGLNTSTDAGNEARYHQLCRAISTALQRGSNDDPRHGEPHAASATEILADDKIDDTARKAAEIIDGDNDT